MTASCFPAQVVYLVQSQAAARDKKLDGSMKLLKDQLMKNTIIALPIFWNFLKSKSMFSFCLFFQHGSPHPVDHTLITNGSIQIIHFFSMILP